MAASTSKATAGRPGDRIVHRHGDGPAIDWRGCLEGRLLEGDEAAAWTVVEGALAAGHGADYCYLDLVAEALSSIAARHARGELDEAHLPLAGAGAHRIVARLGARFCGVEGARGSVVLGAPAGERHSLPIAIVADLVRLRGLDVLELGADVPAAAFGAAVARAPRLVAVGLGVTCIAHIEAARQAVAAIHAVDPTVPVIVGGQAVRSPEIARLIGATAWAATGRDAATVVDQLAPAPSG